MVVLLKWVGSPHPAISRRIPLSSYSWEYTLHGNYLVSVMDVHSRDKHNGGSYLSRLGHHTQL